MDFIGDDIYSNNPELEFKKREYVYLSSITNLEFELERLKNTLTSLPVESLNALANNASDSNYSLDGIPVHPLVKLELDRLRREVHEKDILLETATTEMNVANFDAHSLIGQRLVLKCKVLQEENKYLGKKILTLKCSNSNSINDYEYQDFLEAEIKKLHCIIEDLEVENQRLSNTIKSLKSPGGDRIHDNYRDSVPEKDKYDGYERYDERSYRPKHDVYRSKPPTSRYREDSYSRRSMSKSPRRSRSYRSPYRSHSHHSSRHRHHN